METLFQVLVAIFLLGAGIIPWFILSELRHIRGQMRYLERNLILLREQVGHEDDPDPDEPEEFDEDGHCRFSNVVAIGSNR